MPDVDFYFDYKSPYSYMANTQVPSIDATVEYFPIDLVTLLELSNNLNRTSATPNKFRYGNVDLARWAKRYGTTFATNDRIREINSIQLASGGIAAQQLNVFPAYHRAVFAACWSENTDVVSRDGRAAIVAAAGIDQDALWTLSEQPHIRERLDENTRRVFDAGGFGAPTFVLDGEIFFGNDRLDFLNERLAEMTAD